jgi:hypothetical protein
MFEEELFNGPSTAEEALRLVPAVLLCKVPKEEERGRKQTVQETRSSSSFSRMR